MARSMVLCAGTSDIPVAEEAALCAELFGNSVERLYDVGVAGLHRLAASLEAIRRASVLIVVAGMEGRVAVGGGRDGDRPVIAVPTSVGYGASFNGIAALLGMLNSCASGVTVVNIDNGFGAAFAATMINRVGPRPRRRLMAERKHLTSGRARRAIKMGGLASQVGSSYLWTSLRKPFLSIGAVRAGMLDTHLKNARRIVEGSQANCAAPS